MRIGIFGGSFDPAHVEHVRLACAAVENLSLDKLLVMPAHTPPHKKNKRLSSDQERLELCRLAFADCPQAEVSDYELCRGGTSYTYLTCRHFKEIYPDAELFWLVGTDMLRDFPSWRNPEDILDHATLAVCARNEAPGWLEEEQTSFYARFRRRFAVIGYNGADVSSTKVRVLAAAGEDLTPLVGSRAAKYIREKNLYAIPHAKEALALEKPSRRAHSIRVAILAAERAPGLGIGEKKVVTAALFHDCAKNLSPGSPLLKGFCPPKDVPAPVLHQYAGAYVAEHAFGISDPEVLDAIRCHTSGREEMTKLDKLIFLSDLLESGREFPGVEKLRAAFWKEKDNVDECLYLALKNTLVHLEKEDGEIYPLTSEAYEFAARELAKKRSKEKKYVGNQK